MQISFRNYLKIRFYCWEIEDRGKQEIEGVARFYIGLANHIKVLNTPNLEKFVDTFVKDILQK